jgi:vacuolar-type H+-ATPase subunit H
MKILKNAEWREEAERMVRDGAMPSLEELSQAVAEARERYQETILASRYLPDNDKDLN